MGVAVGMNDCKVLGSPDGGSDGTTEGMSVLGTKLDVHVGMMV